MSVARYALLEDRGVLALAGPDTLGFLQKIVTNDVEPVGAGRAVFAALLTPQGRYLHDFILVPGPAGIFVDCERLRIDDLKRRLTMYRLRAKVSIDDRSDSLGVHAAFGTGAAAALELDGPPGEVRALGEGVAFIDPRLPQLGARALLPRLAGPPALEKAGLSAATAADYRRHRRILGVAEGDEIGVDRTLALEAGLDVLNGVSFSKGCYIGQEVTSRMRNRNLVRKRIVPATVEGPPPEHGAAVRLGDSEAGAICVAEDGIALALLRLESVAEAGKNSIPLTAGEARLTLRKAEWLNLPTVPA